MGHVRSPAKNSIPFNLTSGRNVVPLSGRILEQTGNQTALDLLSELFSTFMNGDASPVVAVGSYIELTDGTRPGWLNRAVQKLQLHLPFQSPSGPLSPIKSITVGSFALSFPSDPAESYAPLASSNSTSASFGLPFGIDMDITSVAVHMALAVNRTLIANISTPYSDAQTQTLTQNAGYETGTMDITIPPSALIIDNTTDAQLAFDQFAFDLVHGNGSSMYLIGQTDVIASCAIGQIALTGVNFAVPAGLIGLSGLQTQPTQALSVDVVGGTSEALILDIEVGLTNPSNLIMAVGDVMLQMHDFDDGSYLGRVVLPDLHLGIGYQTSVAKVYYQANANPTALGILSKVSPGICLSTSPLTVSGVAVYLRNRFAGVHLGLQRKHAAGVVDAGIHGPSPQNDSQRPRHPASSARKPYCLADDGRREQYGERAHCAEQPFLVCPPHHQHPEQHHFARSVHRRSGSEHGLFCPRKSNQRLAGSRSWTQSVPAGNVLSASTARGRIRNGPCASGRSCAAWRLSVRRLLVFARRTRLLSCYSGICQLQLVHRLRNSLATSATSSDGLTPLYIAASSCRPMFCKRSSR